MDPGRYGPQQGWDNNSAPEGYGALHETNFRVGGSYDERRFIKDRYSRDNVYPRTAFHRDVLDRDNYAAPHHGVDIWPHSRRRNYEDEFSIDRGSRRHDKQYMDSYHEMDNLRDHEIDTYQKFDKLRDGYHGADRTSRLGKHDRNDYSYDGFEYRTGISHKTRGDSHDRDYDYGRHSYDSDYDRSSRREGSLRRRESRECDRDKKGVSRERETSPYKRHERSRSRSRSRGHDDRSRSRSPRSCSHGRSYREDSYDDGRYERTDKRRDRDEKRQRDHYSVAPSATIVVKGLSQKTTEEDLY